MQFGSLQHLWLLWLLAALAAFYLYVFKRKKRNLERFAKNELLKTLINSVSTRKQKIKPLLIILSTLFLILTLTQPEWGFHWEEVKRKGIDIIIALDVSKSMLADDIKPSRLERAKIEIKSLINTLKGDRIGLVAFAGSAFLQCPLTLDYAAAKLFLDNIDIESIPRGGTDIGGAIKKAVEAFEGKEKKHRALILITDGEDHRKRAMDAVEEAKKKGVVIYTIGIGRQEGAPIPIIDEKGNKRYVRDRSGNIVLSKLDTVLLQKIALMTGGKKGTIGAGTFPLEDIYRDEISKMEKKELKSKRHKRFEQRFQWPLAMAIILLFLEAIMSERKTSVYNSGRLPISGIQKQGGRG